ncbi:MAG: NADPH-dependent reductase [Betaproteobacteria bacterium]|nr:NADPH-dependent reductase [Betaproteobacteria bacterium]
MTKILGISGSLRKASFNTMLLNQAAKLTPEGVQFEIGTIKGIPLYDGDVEDADGIPSAVQALKTRIMDCDGLLIVTPEYNNSLPGVLKNAVDWLTRPPADSPRVFGQRPIAIIGATPGNFGTTLAQTAWLPVLRTLGTRPYFGGRLMVSRAESVFTVAGDITDEAVTAQVRKFMHGFVEFVQSCR